MHCRSCGLEFQHPQPSWEDIQKVYSSEYYASWDMKRSENEITSRMKRLTFARRLSELSRYVHSGPILDIGTATGFFLDEVRAQKNFEPYGVELSEYAGGIAAEKFGKDRIHIGTVETAPFPPAFFSAVAMSDLIEHVQEPLALLQKVHQLLRPGGVAMIMTPDPASLTRKLMGPKWTHFKLEHLFYFTPESIRKLASDVGFRVLSTSRAKKLMTLKYLRDQLSVYPHPLLTPASRALSFALKPWEQNPFPVTMGELLAFLQKV
jgi:2-polyprenyl-3-methyl-5-hydroxy-6-metoxy-1,4-benzoquinol methylase